MSKEKIIKKQAREALKGNTMPILAGILLSALVFVLLQNLMYVILIAFDAIDLETEKMNAGSDLPYMLTMAGTIIAGVLLSPFFNGMYKTAANAVIKGENQITDLFFFFSGIRRYLKTLLVNMTVALLFGVITRGAETLLSSFVGTDGAYGVITSVISGIISFLAYALFVHYPLCLYAIDDSSGAGRYMFGCIGFSFRHFWALIRLIFSMFGWILLCFFVVPALYVGPYALCAAVDSAYWLKKADDEKTRSNTQPEYTGYTQQYR